MVNFIKVRSAAVLVLFSFFALSSINATRVCAEEVQAPVVTPTAQRAGLGDAFDAEELNYKIGFWFLDNVAVGKVRFRKVSDGEFIATLEARTTGLAGWLTKTRTDTYVSNMALSPDSKRFVTRKFFKTTTMRGRTRYGVKVVDYESRTVTRRSWGGGKEEKTGVETIPEGVYTDDPLCAFYNFRAGVYGPTEEGREYKINGFPKDGRVSKVYLRIATNEEMESRGAETHGARYLADARIDKDLFGSQTGDIEIFFSPAMEPLYAVAKDILFFGDIRGTLVR